MVGPGLNQKEGKSSSTSLAIAKRYCLLEACKLILDITFTFVLGLVLCIWVLGVAVFGMKNLVGGLEIFVALNLLVIPLFFLRRLVNRKFTQVREQLEH